MIFLRWVEIIPRLVKPFSLRGVENETPSDASDVPLQRVLRYGDESVVGPFSLKRPLSMVAHDKVLEPALHLQVSKVRPNHTSSANVGQKKRVGPQPELLQVKRNAKHEAGSIEKSDPRKR